MEKDGNLLVVMCRKKEGEQRSRTPDLSQGCRGSDGSCIQFTHNALL